MSKRTAISALWVLGLGLAGAQSAGAALPQPLADALQGAELDTREGWAYRLTTQVDAMDEPAVTSVVRWDPSKPPAERCTVVSTEVKGVAAGKGSHEDPCDEAGDRELYRDLVEYVDDATIEVASEDEETVVYRVKQRSKKGFHMGGMHVDIGDEDLEDLEGKLTVVKTGEGAPYVQRFALGLRQPAGNMLARLGQLDLVFSYAPDPGTGAKLISGMSLDLQLRLFGLFNVSTHVKQQYDEYRRVQ
jgi:hypothetical protein